MNASLACGVSVLRRVLYDLEKCRVFAATCSDQAERAPNPSNRRAWVDLAQQWLDLAADIEAIGEGRVPSAPVHRAPAYYYREERLSLAIAIRPGGRTNRVVRATRRGGFTPINGRHSRRPRLLPWANCGHENSFMAAGNRCNFPGELRGGTCRSLRWARASAMSTAREHPENQQS
jgi:hypothetical protein